MTVAILLLCGCDGQSSLVGPSVEPALQPSVLPLVTPGQYIVTLRADPLCNLPDFTRQRRFTAQIYVDPWEGSLFGEIIGATIRPPEYYDFWFQNGSWNTQMFYVGNYFGNFGIMEEIDQGLVLLFGKALLAPSQSRMSGSLDGEIGYCAGSAGPGSSPSEACRNPPVICQSDKHQLNLERQ